MKIRFGTLDDIPDFVDLARAFQARTRFKDYTFNPERVAANLQANIHGGAGNDIAMVVGDAGVTLNLAQAEIESVVGGRGNDVFIGGGRSSIFVRAGDGDDTVIGGAANDAVFMLKGGCKIC